MELTIKPLLERAKKLQQKKDLPAAQKIYQQILKKCPNHAETLNFLAMIYLQLKQPEQAIIHLKLAQSKALVPQLLHNLGLAYQMQKNWQQALFYFQQAIQHFPNYHPAWHQLGNVYTELGQWEPAQSHFKHALALRPDYPECWIDLGDFYNKLGKISLAIKAYEYAVRFNDQSFAGYFALGNCYAETSEFQQAIAFYQKALKIEPKNTHAYANLCRIYDQICDWHNYEDRQQRLLQQVKKELQCGERVSINPFTALTQAWPPAVVANIARNYTSFLNEKLSGWHKEINFEFNQRKKNKLRLGYLSCGFGDHPTSQLTYRLFECHNRQYFEIFAFSLKHDNHPNLTHFSQHADQFHDMSKLSAVAAAKLIYENEIDILIDLDGHIRGNHIAITALRPAPVQIHYLGFPGSTGAEFIDYFIADATVVTPEAAQHYAEKIIYLPECYQITNNQQPIAPSSATRATYNLPEDAIVFCCFNNTYKIEPIIFKTWCDILHAVPNSVLWLLSHSDLTKENLKAHATHFGIDPQRLIFANFIDKSLHLARYRLADLFLDTLYCNAHTTASDALWAGLPVITCPQQNFASRVGASLLKAVGLPELIASDLAHYRELAINLAQHPQQLQQVRQKLQKIYQTSALFNTEEKVKQLEKCYQQIWNTYQNT